MKIFFITFLFIFFNYLVIAQTKKIWTGEDSITIIDPPEEEKLIKKGEYSKALNMCLQKRALNPNDLELKFMIAEIYDILQMPDSVYYTLKPIWNEPTVQYKILFSRTLYNLWFSGKYDSILHDLSARFYTKHILKKYHPIVEDIIKMGIRDQYHRLLPNAQTNDSLLKILRRNDSVNTNVLQKIIQHYSLPKKQEISPELYNIVMLILNHTSNLKLKEKVLPIIKNRCLNDDKDDCVEYAMIYDKYTMLKYHYQYYGTQFCYDKQNNAYDYCPIFEIDNLNKRRSAIKFYPIIINHKKQ